MKKPTIRELIFKPVLIRLANLRKEFTSRFGTETDRHYLLAFAWTNSLTGKDGLSSTIVHLDANDVMDAEKVKDFQITILDQISNVGHPNDPTDIVIISVSRLE